MSLNAALIYRRYPIPFPRLYYLQGLGRIDNWIKEATVVTLCQYFTMVHSLLIVMTATMEDHFIHGHLDMTALFHESVCRQAKTS